MSFFTIKSEGFIKGYLFRFYLYNSYVSLKNDYPNMSDDTIIDIMVENFKNLRQESKKPLISCLYSLYLESNNKKVHKSLAGAYVLASLNSSEFYEKYIGENANILKIMIKTIVRKNFSPSYNEYDCNKKLRRIRQ